MQSGHAGQKAGRVATGDGSGDIHRYRAHGTCWLLCKPLVSLGASTWMQALGLGAVGSHPHPTSSWGFASPALHSPSLSSPDAQPYPSPVPSAQGSSQRTPVPCREPRLSLCPQQAPCPHLTAAVPWSHHPRLQPAQGSLQDTPPPTESHQARGRPPRGDQKETNTSSICWEPGLVAWEGGNLGPPAPVQPPGALGSGPTKSSRSGVGLPPVVLGTHGSGEPTPHLDLSSPAQPYHSQLVLAHLAAPPLSHLSSHGLTPQHPPQPHLRPSPGSHGCRPWKGLYCRPWGR